MPVATSGLTTRVCFKNRKSSGVIYERGKRSKDSLDLAGVMTGQRPLKTQRNSVFIRGPKSGITAEKGAKQ